LETVAYLNSFLLELAAAVATAAAVAVAVDVGEKRDDETSRNEAWHESKQAGSKFVL
jgi:hypothetical protein